MENEADNITTVPSTSTNVPSVVVERPLSPFERIVAGTIDGKPLSQVDGKMDGLLIALAKTLKLLTRDKVSAHDKRRAYEELERISIDDIRKACEDASIRTINAITSFEDVTVQKIPAPVIDENPTDYVSPQASKDFSARINNGYFCGVQKHTVRMKDILNAVSDVVTFYKLSPKAALNLLRRCLRDPARQLMENLVESGASLEDLFDNLQDHYNSGMSCGEASQRLRTLLNNPITNLDDFLGDLLNWSICSVKDLPASEQNKCGFLMANGYLQSYLYKQYPHLSSIIKHDLKQIQSAQRGKDPAASYLAMMRVLRLHRDALETGGSRRNHRVGAGAIAGINIDSMEHPSDPYMIQENTGPLMSPSMPKGPSAQEIRDIIRDEIRQNSSPTRPELSQEVPPRGIKEVVQEIMHGVMNARADQAPTPYMEACGLNNPEWNMYNDTIQEVNNPPWARNEANKSLPVGNRPPNGQLPNQGVAQPGQQANYRPKWMPQVMQKVGQIPPRPPFYPQGNQQQNPNFIPLGQPRPDQYGIPRRNPLPEDVYAKHFAAGNCFLCAMTGHSFRQCPIFGQGHKLTSEPCPNCEQHGIKAYHEDCQGRNIKAHQNMQRGHENVNRWNNNGNPNQVSQIDMLPFYPEEGDGQEAVPLYIPDGGEWPKNE